MMRGGRVQQESTQSTEMEAFAVGTQLVSVLHVGIPISVMEVSSMGFPGTQQTEGGLTR